MILPRLKTEEGGLDKMCDIVERLTEEARQAGIAEGQAIGKAEGLAEGKAEGLAEGANDVKSDIAYIKPYIRKYDDDSVISRLTGWAVGKVADYRALLL